MSFKSILTPVLPCPVVTSSASGKLLCARGGCAFCRSAVRHSHPSTMQTEWQGHHKWFTHWPLPGQCDLHLGRWSVRQKYRCQQDAPMTMRQENVQKKLCWNIIFHEICNFPLLIFHLNIHVFCCETNFSRSRYLLLCFCYIFVPWACYWHLHPQQTVLSTGQVRRVSWNSISDIL